MNVESLPQLNFFNQAFKLEYDPSVDTQSLYEDAESYLAEYRFRVRLKDYNLFYDRVRGEIFAKDGERMSDKVRRGIMSRALEGGSTHREEADLSGILSLEGHLKTARRDDLILWASPPEEKNVEYGKYGFIYYGRLGAREGEKEKINITAVRINDRNLEKYAHAVSAISGQENDFKKPEDFIANPYVLQKFEEPDVLSVLSSIFNFRLDFNEEVRRQQAMELIQPDIDKFIDSVKNFHSETSKQENFIKLEWYAEKVWKKLEENKTQQDFNFRSGPIRAYELVGFYDGSKLDRVEGTCGPTAGGLNIFSKYSSIKRFITSESYKDDPNLCHCTRGDGPHFHCPGTRESHSRCDHPIVVGRNIKKCPSCGLEATCK